MEWILMLKMRFMNMIFQNFEENQLFVESLDNEFG